MRNELQRLRDQAEQHCHNASADGDADTADAWEAIGLALDACQKAIAHQVRLIEERTGMMTDRARAPDISEAAWDAARTIVVCWEDWEEHAGREAQQLQRPVEDDELEWQVAIVVQGAIDESLKP